MVLFDISSVLLLYCIVLCCVVLESVRESCNKVFIYSFQFKSFNYP